MSEKWIVQRAGVPDHWMPGWFALCQREMGEAAWFPTWHEAQAFALERASLSMRAAGLAAAFPRWGMDPSRIPPTIGAPLRSQGRGLSKAQLLVLFEMRAAGKSVTDIATHFRLSPAAIYGYLKNVKAA